MRSPSPLLPRRRLPIPGELGALLAVYVAGVLLYLGAAYWTSPEYQAARHYDRAMSLLGPNEGKEGPEENLTLAYLELLAAAEQFPSATELHREMERLNSRFEERHLRQDPVLRRRAEALAMRWQREREEQQPLLASGVRERGWAPEQLIAGPGRTLGYAVLGAGALVVGWLTLRGGREKQARLERGEALEAEVQARARSREWQNTAPGGDRGKGSGEV